MIFGYFHCSLFCLKVSKQNVRLVSLVAPVPQRSVHRHENSLFGHFDRRNGSCVAGHPVNTWFSARVHPVAHEFCTVFPNLNLKISHIVVDQ